MKEWLIQHLDLSVVNSEPALRWRPVATVPRAYSTILIRPEPKPVVQPPQHLNPAIPPDQAFQRMRDSSPEHLREVLKAKCTQDSRSRFSKPETRHLQLETE